ncbi:MAG: metallophosphoesterase family protein [Bradymonadia bacterium]
MMLWPAWGNAQVWGVRTLPDGPERWQIRWMGTGDVSVDGQRLEQRRSPLSLDGRQPHDVRVGARHFTVPAQIDDACAHVRLIALGDGRAAVNGVGPSAGWRGILSEALGHQPDLVINTGDLVKRGRDPQEWRQWLLSLPPWPPVLPVKGNHDRGGLYEALGYDPRPVFVWRWGPVEIIGVNTEASTEEMLPALKAALSVPAERWRILVTHRPIWSRGNHGSDERGLNAQIVPLIDRGGVDLVLSGHDHDYERFCRSRGLGPERCHDEGTLYVVTGGAATFTVPVPGLSFKVDSEVAEADGRASRVFSGSHHFVQVDVGPERLVLTAHRTFTGNVRPPGIIDEFVLKRSSRCEITRPRRGSSRP